MTGKPEVNFPIADHPPRVVLRMTNFTPPDKSLAQQVLRQKCSKRLFVLPQQPGNVRAVTRIGRLAGAGAALLLLRSSGTERDRQLPIATRSWLENPGTPRPTGDVALQERSEIFGDWWKFPARESDLRKLKGHYGVD